MSTQETTQNLEDLKRAPKESGIHPVISHRWSPRAFADKPVTTEDLTKIFDAARWAASSYNEQPWRFVVGRKGDATYQKIFDSLIEFNQGWAKSAPVLVLSTAKKTFSHNGAPNGYGIHDTGAATATLTLQATALGLHSHGMAGFDKDKARAAFNIPEDFEIGAVTALGYLGDPETLPEGLKAQETSPRTRKPLEEVVFSEWGQPAKL
jgi:nitroreductase